VRLQPVLEVVDRLRDHVGVEVEVDQRFAGDAVFGILLQVLAQLLDGCGGVLEVRLRFIFRNVETDQRVADHPVQLREALAVDRPGLPVVIECNLVVLFCVSVIGLADLHPRLHLLTTDEGQ
jgi:hypothetical protein